MSELKKSAPSDFALNRRPEGVIVVFGDGPDRAVTKALWSAVGSGDVKVKNIDSEEDFVRETAQALLSVVVIDPAGQRQNLGPYIADRQDALGDVVAIAPDADTGRRIALLASGFDSAFNMEMVAAPDFRKIIGRKLARARRTQTSRILQEEYIRFREALKASPDAFIIFDHDKRIFFVSEHYKRAYPNIADKLVRGLHVEDAFELARIEQGVNDGDPRFEQMKNFWFSLQGQVEFRMKIGHEFRFWRVRAAPLGEGMGTIVTTTDITDIILQKREIEEKSRQLAESLEKEQEASALQKQFIAMVSHEFRTPLAIIDGHAHFLQKRRDEEDSVYYNRIKTIRSAVSRLVHMMEGVLSSNLLKTGNLDPVPVECDLRELIENLCEEQMILGKPDSITWDTTLLPGSVLIDERIITLILSNLLSNAVKFTPDQPDIRVHAAASEDRLVIQVSDNGRGIPLGEQEKIFDRYYRATTSMGIPGTGIGLSLVRDLVKLLGGGISVESTPGKGTRFTLDLPYIKP
jgi:signal transduction histidine kinase